MLRVLSDNVSCRWRSSKLPIASHHAGRPSRYHDALKEGVMKTDHEVRRMLNERRKGKTQEQAAARASMSVRTARKYERLAQLPSQIKKPRGRTRPNPFEADWPWVQAQLERDPAL